MTGLTPVQGAANAIKCHIIQVHLLPLLHNGIRDQTFEMPVLLFNKALP